MIDRTTTWVTRPEEAKLQAEALAKEVNMNPIVVEFLTARGYDTAEKIHTFMDFKKEDLRSYSTYKDVDEFLDILVDSLKHKETITIYGDYDADGVCATTIWVRALRKLRANVHFFVNNRFTEGYGLNEKGMKRLLEQFPDTNLVITCDNGVVAIDGVNYAQEHGVKVIISDHHIARPDGKLPNCPVVCEHRLDESHELKESICGAEMSRRLVIGLYDKLGLTEKATKFCDQLACFSGMATITDSVPFGPANHFLAKFGLQQITNSPFPCWRILRDLTDAKELTEQTIGFTFGPIINAISRIEGDVTKDIEMFIENDPEKCADLARELVQYNNRRKDMSKANDTIAEQEYKLKRKDDSFVILTGGMMELDSNGLHPQNYDEGICGLVSSHIVEATGKPCITLTRLRETPDIYKGSARSIDGFNVKAALDQCTDILEGYGGHAGAAGLSVKEENIDALRERLSAIVDESGVLDQPKVIEIDCIVTPDEANNAIVDELNKLAPFGVGFESPNICLIGTMKDFRYLKQTHTKLSLKGNTNTMDVLWWKSLNLFAKLTNGNAQPGMKFAIIGDLQINSYQGRISTQMIVKNNNVKLYDEECIQKIGFKPKEEILPIENYE